MKLVVGVTLILLTFMVALATQRDRSLRLIAPLLAGTLFTVFLFRAVEAGNDKIGWLAIPVIVAALAAIPAVLRRDKLVSNTKLAALHDKGQRSAANWARRLAGPFALLLLVSGILVAYFSLRNANPILQVFVGLLWFVAILLGLMKFMSWADRRRMR